MDGIALMATAMEAAKKRLDVSAGNLANVSSDGFHKRLAHVRLGERGLVTSSSVDGSQGALRHTGRAFDLALAGPGALYVREAGGRSSASRGGSFVLDAHGHLCDERGRPLEGARGPVRIGSGSSIDPTGAIRENGAVVARLRTAPGTNVQSGFIESGNVDAVHEMIEVLDAQRAFETAQKTLGAIDGAREKDVNDVVRIKA